MSQISCPHCKEIEQRVNQHEQFIMQLLKIIAATNEKVLEVEKRQAQLEKPPFFRTRP
ncbi:hypothetical protein EDD68_1431 [Melghiribacillus thermohalophilus]|uniref:Uncharacterized protein n=1 Tax=Melghiribacillus thermohalophilus TaxID=1324956 RepID=A0A4R3MNX7_9BACI|nr:hypothetical protein [Melghiribacillus thermohalophilus]TCT14389.1 hypothetical protein EDD68_1431 [Melghiribacillus thermohalophilus]